MNDPPAYTVQCPLSDTSVRFEKVGGRALAYEPWVNTDGLFIEFGVGVAQRGRCPFAALITAQTLTGKQRLSAGRKNVHTTWWGRRSPECGVLWRRRG